MRKKILYVTGLAALTAVYAAAPAATPTAPAPSTLTFPTYGFRINSFETPTNSPILGAVQMSFPPMPLPSGNNQYFPPSVNVMIVSSDKGMDDYVTSERLGLTTRGFSIVKNGDDTSVKNEWRIEYIGVVSNIAMHWYAHAVLSNGRVYIATGGVPDEMWPQYGDKIKACVNSLQATGTAVTTPPPALSLASPGAPVPAAKAPTATTAK